MRPARLTLSPGDWAAMQEQAADEAPLEACGLLAGKDGRVELFLPMRNAARSPVRFRLDPREQLEAFEQLDVQGLELVGISHSHPGGPATPSPTDVEEAAYPVVHVIVSQAAGEWTARGFWIEGGSVDEIPLVISR